MSIDICRLMATVCVCACAGCASIVEGTTQIITVSTSPEIGASCVCSNDRGQWPLTTPGSVEIKKSQSVLEIHCNKPGYQEGKFYAAGRMSTASMVGIMLPYAGIVNAAVDASSGASLTYPSSYTIEMKPAPAAGAAASPPPQGSCAPNTDCKKDRQ